MRLWRSKGFDEALTLQFDDAKKVAAKRMIPLFRLWFVLGWGVGTVTPDTIKADTTGLTLGEIMALYPDIGAQILEMDAAADRFIAGYFDDWWRQLTETTQTRLRSAIELARTSGIQPKEVAALVEDLFGRTRAELISTTEVTRLVGGGMQASYEAAGLNAWAWQTVHDSRVCPRCSPLNGKVFPIAIQFEPIHPVCRCFPRPVVPAYA